MSILIEAEKFILQEKEKSSTIKVFFDDVKISGKKNTVQIFGILESNHPSQDILLNYITEQFAVIFANVSEKNKKNDTGEIFEQTLQDLNHNTTAFIKDRNILVDFDTLNGAIAVLAEHDIYFTYIGSVSSLLIHRVGKDNYKTIEILDNVSGSAVKPTIFKIFSNVISGQIQNEDALFFSTANVINSIDCDKIKQLVITNNTSDAIKKTQSLLKPTKNNGFGAILLKINPKPIESIIEIEPQKPTEEEKPKTGILSKLLNKKEKEEVEVENEEIKNENEEEESEKIETEETKEPESENIYENNTENQPKTEYQQPNIRITQAIREAKQTTDINSESSDNEELNSYASKPKHNAKNYKNKIFSYIGKGFLLIALIAAIAFVYNLKKDKKQQISEKQETKYSESIAIIENNLVSIDTKLIINKNDEALKIIEQTQRLIAQLPQDKKYKKAEYQKQLTDFSNKIKNIINIENPTLITELANPATNIVKEKDAIYLYNEKNSLYKLDLTSKKVKAIALDIEDKGTWRKNTPEFEEGKTLLLYNGSGLSQYDFVENELTSIDINLASGSKIDDINFYGQKLYLLDGANNKIYKHVKVNKNSFNSGANWLTENTDLSGAISMAIDSNIWVLKNNGEILKFFKNKKVDFQVKTIDPPLSSPTKIYTTLEMKNIYILEPKNNRLVVIDKLGNMLGQFTSEKFDNLLDFVLEKDKTGKETGRVYLLNGLKMFEIETELK